MPPMYPQNFSLYKKKIREFFEEHKEYKIIHSHMSELGYFALKEAAMIAGASFLYGKELVVSSRWFGKLATVLFYIAIVCSFVIAYWNNIAKIPSNSIAPLPQFDLWIYYLALATTIFSLVMYYITFYKQGYLKKENLKIDEK